MVQIKKQEIFFLIINLLMNNDKYCVEIGKKVGAVLRTQMLRRAKELNISVTNQKSKKVERLEKRVKKAN